MELAAYLACGLLVVLVVVVIDLAITARGLRSDVSLLRSIIEDGLHFFMFEQPNSWFGSSGIKGFGSTFRRDGGFCVWVFRGGSWLVEGDYCAEGYEPGPPPGRTGVVEGYAIRQLAVKKRPH